LIRTIYASKRRFVQRPARASSRGRRSSAAIDKRHGLVGDPTLADAILDRLVHNAHRLTLKGESMRKIAAAKTPLDAKAAS
jgi:hypothetical protein